MYVIQRNSDKLYAATEAIYRRGPHWVKLLSEAQRYGNIDSGVMIQWHAERNEPCKAIKV